MDPLLTTSNISCLNFRQVLPDLRLQPWVQCYWSIGGHPGPEQVTEEKLYPDAGSSLSIYLAGHQPLITYQFNIKTVFQVFSSATPCLSIRFKPGGAYYLLGLEPAQFSGQTVCPGVDVYPGWLSSLMEVVENLYRVDSCAGFRLLEEWLLKRLMRSDSGNKAMQKIVTKTDWISCSSDELAGRVGCSQRTLERKLKLEVGMSPGQLIACARLNFARRLLYGSTTPLAEVALQCGYYDQAHFSHSFHRFAFETPASYRKRKLSQIYKPLKNSESTLPI